MVKYYRKKPVLIKAVQLTVDNADEVMDWVGQEYSYPGPEGIFIETLEGNHLARWGDFVIQGVQGEFYPCKPDIFDATYDVLQDQNYRPMDMR